ncbi:MAG: right-handed parallel beta-helix repeat-containing protein, partial [Anaerolineae bacterium]
GLQGAPSIHGFVIRNGRFGIEAHSPVSVENNYFSGSQVAIDYQPGSGGTNRNNVYFASVGDSLRVEQMSQPLVIENNRFLYSGDDAIELGLPGIAMTAPLEVDILNNVLAGSTQDGIKLVDYATNPRDYERRVIIAGNLFASNHRAGIGIVSSADADESYSGLAAAESVWVYQNTFYGNDYGISGGANLVAFNNIIGNSTSRGAWRVQPAPGSNSVVAYTLFWKNRVDADQTLLGPANLFNQDPLFAGIPDPGPDGRWGTVDDDFSGLLLRPDSPAIDRGAAQFVTAGREGIPLDPLSGFSGSAPDLGWREFGGMPVARLIPLPTSTPRQGLPPLVAPSPTIAREPARVLTPDVPPSPQAFPEAGAGRPPLSITSSVPGSVHPGGHATLTIKGSGFQAGATLNFEGLDEEAPQVESSLVVDSNTMQAQVRDTDDDKDKDVWNLRVTNPDGASALLTGALTVAP